MDVTSMLNTSSEAERHPSIVEVAKTSSRDRVPWDADGYSPFGTQKLTDYSYATESSREVGVDQRRHKLSDSHSSLSSFTSSESASHSRFSSMSTVSSFHPHTHATQDSTFSETEAELRLSKTAPESSSPISPRTRRSKLHSTPSPTGCDGIATFAGSPREEPTRKAFMVAELARSRPISRLEDIKEAESSANQVRPASPSDAILIKRNARSITPHLFESSGMALSDRVSSEDRSSIKGNAIIVPDQELGRLSIETRTHKRTLSAPNFPGTFGQPHQSEYRPSSSTFPLEELTPPSSQHPNSSSPGDSMFFAAPNTPPEMSVPSLDWKPCCMYITNCDTGSQLRKAVSHIFGRNKMCTRRIPTHVWVWYCRKHYQRARYRNSKEWARTLQYDLVSRQIRRLQEWSEENTRTGQGGVVKDYRLAVRKREQRRLDAQKPKGDREYSESEDDDPGDTQSEAPSNTAVPKWILDLSGRSHNAKKIMQIIDGIQVDLASGALTVWPDIEILPNIIVDQVESQTPKGHVQRKCPASTHKRSQSLATLKAEEFSSERSLNQRKSAPCVGHNAGGVYPQKRKRYDDASEEADPFSSPQSQRIRTSDNLVAAGRLESHLVHRSTFQSMNEHYGGLDNHNNAPAIIHGAPLPAPTPQRYNTLSAASHLDTGVAFSERDRIDFRRGSHQRSQSDMGAFPNSRASFHILPKQGQPAAQSQYYDAPDSRRYFTPSTLRTSLHQPEVSDQRVPAHMRHQSTPIVHQSHHYQPNGRQYLPKLSSPPPAFGRHANASMDNVAAYSDRR